MQKIRVNFILGLVVAAMLALLFIQAFQTAQMYDRKSTEFKDRFGTILDRIAMRHEKAEDVRKYLQIVNKDFDVRYKDILKEEFRNLLSAKESISITDTTIIENGQEESYLIIQGQTFDSLSGVTAQQRVLARDVRQLRDLFQRKPGDDIEQDSIDLAVQLDQRVIQQIFKKARFVNELMVEAFKSNVYEAPNERIDITFLDSVLATELESENLPSAYNFAVTDEYRNIIHFDNEPINYLTSLDSVEVHSTLLFPSNTLDEDLYLYMSFPKQKSFLLKEMWVPLVISLSLFAFIIIALTFMFRTILTQKKLSEIKNDFISNMTHEFKTPISTISLACQAMNDSDMNAGQIDTVAPYINMINAENQRLSVLVERILQSATLDKGDIKMKEEPVLLNEIIHDQAQNAQLRLKNKNGIIELDLTSELIEIQADAFHTKNVISNLIDNAIKYSPKDPRIKISLSKENGLIKLAVQDNGIGIKKEHINKIFDKLYRIPTGNVHNVKGFGLGLSYVKAICEIHKWNITVRSKYEEGSTFTIEIKA